MTSENSTNNAVKSDVNVMQYRLDALEKELGQYRVEHKEMHEYTQKNAQDLQALMHRTVNNAQMYVSSHVETVALVMGIVSGFVTLLAVFAAILGFRKLKDIEDSIAQKADVRLDEALRESSQHIEEHTAEMLDQKSQEIDERFGALYDRLKDQSDKIDQQSKEIKALENLTQGNAAFNREEYARAVEYYDVVTELNPSFITAHYNRGLSKAKLGDFAGAIGDCEYAIEMDPENASTYYNLARVYTIKGDEDQAIKHLCKSINLNPSFADRTTHDGHLESLYDSDKFIKLLESVSADFCLQCEDEDADANTDADEVNSDISKDDK